MHLRLLCPDSRETIDQVQISPAVARVANQSHICRHTCQRLAFSYQQPSLPSEETSTTSPLSDAKSRHPNCSYFRGPKPLKLEHTLLANFPQRAHPSFPPSQSTTMGVSMSTLMGWVAVLGLFGGYAFREWTRSRQAQLARTEAHRLRQERQTANVQKDLKKFKPKETKPKETKPKRRPEDATQGSDAKPKASAPAAAPVAANNYNYSSDDDTARNKEFARQLSNVKQGTKFTGKTKDDSRQKSVKQSRAEEVPVVADTGRASAPSSTAGIDADDDSSSAATSPVLAAVQAGNVDDMLESSAPGPSVLRLTGTEEKASYKNAKPKASPEPAETKKQRQNRKKAEVAKAEREAAEKDRKVKQEAQRRAARQAEGRAAKDGSAFVAAQANQSNAWTGNGTNGKAASASSASSGTNGFVPVQPLDTFDSNVVQTNASKSSVPSYDKGEDWMSSLPSEEDQIELLRGEDSWNTVKTKGRKNKTKEATSTEETPTPATTKAAAPATAPAPAAATITTAALNDKKRPKQIATQSSFAALAVDGTVEDQEEEWDV